MTKYFIEKFKSLGFNPCCYIEDDVDKNDDLIVYKITTRSSQEIELEGKMITTYISTKIIFNRKEYIFYRLPGNFYIKMLYFDELDEPIKDFTMDENPYDLLTSGQLKDLNDIFDSYINNLNKFSKHLK